MLKHVETGVDKLESWSGQNEHLVFLLLDPSEELVDGGDDLQLGRGGAEHRVQFKGLREPTKDNFLIGGIVTQLQWLGRRQKPVLDSKIYTIEAFLILW